MNYLAFLLDTAGDAAGNAADDAGSAGLAGGMGFTWIIMIVMLVGMWWFTSRSQKKKDKEAQDMRDSLQVGDEVTTIGGIIGKIVSIKEDTFVLETTKDKTKIRFHK
ncbi:MAG: preprotein translocase subunit YajC, partial [Rikenellaceae bacterium]|nr:preprotein translocase subunit YajC [Rikenellaceae bacterium]